MRDLLEKEKGAYRSQAHTARKRGIKFVLTFEEWHQWWITQLGPNWMKFRGRTRGKYCMARFGDKGAYQLGNIKCITVGENHSEGHRPNKFLVKGIYQEKGCLIYIASKFHVDKSMVFDIRHKRSWVEFTSTLKYGGNCACRRTGVNGRNCPQVRMK